MDKEGTTSRPSSASGQQISPQPPPTYTTAGTIYNPSASQPLQPPTRRSRSCRWSAGNAHSDLALLPRSFLHALSGRYGTGQPFIPQYAPLQQNYDRAASPLKIPTPNDNMTLVQIPEDESNIQPTLTGDELIPEADIEVEDEREDEDDDDDDERIKTLTLNMTTKSLQNLASYPNPSQKSAQKALKVAQAARLRVNLQYSPAGLDSDSFACEKPASLDRHVGLSTGIFRHTQSEPTPLRLHRAPSQPNEANVQASCSSDAMPAQLHARSPIVTHLSPLTYSEAAGGGRHGSDVLAAGPGVPRPLTAGPPGQRQYRPSAFDLAFGTNGRSKTEPDGCYELRGSAVGRPSATLHTKLDGALAKDMELDGLGHASYRGSPAQSVREQSNSLRWLRAGTPQIGQLRRPQYKSRPGPGDAIRRRDHIEHIWFSGIRALEDTLARIDGEMQRAMPDGGESRSGIASSEPVLALALASLTLAVEEQSYQPGGNYQCYSDTEPSVRLPARQATRVSSRSGSESGMSLLYTHWQAGDLGDSPMESRFLIGE